MQIKLAVFVVLSQLITLSLKMRFNGGINVLSKGMLRNSTGSAVQRLDATILNSPKE